MRLIGPTTNADLIRLRKIRNEFAHRHLSASFEEKNIREQCLQFSAAQSKLLKQMFAPFTGRSAFMVSAASLANELMVRGLSLEHAPPGIDIRFIK
jgi:hypothetical protein